MGENDAMRVLIVDDEPLARSLMRAYVERHPELVLAGEAADGEEAVTVIREAAPDVVLLDVEMPGLDGFGVLDALRRAGARVPALIFATAFDRYAVRAFEVNAVDYLLKPITGARFAKAVARARRRVAGRGVDPRTLLEDALHLPPRRLLVRSGAEVVAVPVADIDWLEADGDYVRIRAGERRWLIEKTLTELVRHLEPRGFARVHRSAAVNLDRVASLRPLGGSRYRLTLRGGGELVASRTYSAALRRRLA